MFVAFGVLALALAAIGLYSVIAYNVVQRTHELGVRVALGAQTGDVVRLVVGEGVRLGAIGVAIGAAIAFGAARWVKPLLFDESPRDPVVFAAVTLVLLERDRRRELDSRSTGEPSRSERRAADGVVRVLSREFCRSVSLSMLPPEKTTPIRLPARRSRSFRAPAKPTAPAPSTRLCVSEMMVRTLSAISASVTVMKSVSPANSAGKVKSYVLRVATPSAKVSDARRAQTLAGMPGIVDRRRTRRLYAVDLESRRDRARDSERTDRLRSAADGDHQRVERRILLDDLHGHRRGAGDDSRIVRRVGDHASLFGGESKHHRDRFVVVTPLLDDRCAQRAHRGVLVGIVLGRHADGRLDAEHRAAVRDSLSVIAGGRRDDAAAPFVVRQRRHERQAVSNLERVDRLMVFVFDEYLNAPTHDVAELRIVAQRSRREIQRQARARGLDVGEGNRPNRIGGGGHECESRGCEPTDRDIRADDVATVFSFGHGI